MSRQQATVVFGAFVVTIGAIGGVLGVGVVDWLVNALAR